MILVAVDPETLRVVAAILADWPDTPLAVRVTDQLLQIAAGRQATLQLSWDDTKALTDVIRADLDHENGAHRACLSEFVALLQS